MTNIMERVKNLNDDARAATQDVVTRFTQVAAGGTAAHSLDSIAHAGADYLNEAELRHVINIIDCHVTEYNPEADDADERVKNFTNRVHMRLRTAEDKPAATHLNRVLGLLLSV